MKATLGLCAWLFSISTKVSNLQLQRFNPALISLRFGNSQSEFEFFKVMTPLNKAGERRSGGEPSRSGRCQGTSTRGSDGVSHSCLSFYFDTAVASMRPSSQHPA